MNDAAAKPDRARLELPNDTCVFLFNFDFLSTTHRKNPGAVIEAFRQAFSPEENALLVMKSINWEHDRAGHAALVQQSAGANVRFLDTHVPGAEVTALFASIDCYVSLHRSEGLGLGMAQAMYLGKPVIATNYSGNLEFMNAENSLLVDYTMTELEEDSGPYERGTHWAAPDVAHAASYMRWVFENGDVSRALGLRAAKSIRQSLDPNATAQQIRQRVEQLA
ncbi:MAG: glycosyltransferase family 4 protein [Chthoniobacterales bacterium]